MLAFIIQRFIQSVVVLLLVTVIIFVCLRLLPGDPIRMYVTMSDEQNYTEEQIADLKHKAGLDRPMVVQYFSWLGGVARGDLGESILRHQPVSEEILRRLPVTFHLGILAFIFGIIIGVPLGIISAVRRGKWLDTLMTFFANIGITVPTFWLGLIFMYVFALYLKWLPVMGYTNPFNDFWMSTKQLVMPVVCLALFPIASTARQTRSSMLEVMRQDYIRTAWAKGLRERGVVFRHALKNGLIPIVTLSGMGIPMIVGGAVLIETVFNIPGMGVLAVDSIFNQDYPYVQGIVLITSVAVLVANFLVEISYGWLDPRIRYD